MANKETSINVAMNESDYDFTIKVISLEESVVTDNRNGKQYTCRNEWHTRNGSAKFYVNVSNVPNKQMKDKFTFPWSAKIMDDGTLDNKPPIGLVHETNLAGKQAAIPALSMFRS